MAFTLDLHSQHMFSWIVQSSIYIAYILNSSFVGFCMYSIFTGAKRRHWAYWLQVIFKHKYTDKHTNSLSLKHTRTHRCAHTNESPIILTTSQLLTNLIGWIWVKIIVVCIKEHLRSQIITKQSCRSSTMRRSSLNAAGIEWISWPIRWSRAGRRTGFAWNDLDSSWVDCVQRTPLGCWTKWP